MKLILILLVFGIEASLNPYGSTIIKDYVNCVSNLITENFAQPGLLVFANSYNISVTVLKIRNEVLKRIHQSNEYVVQLVTPDDKMGICYDNNSYDISLLHMNQHKVIPLTKYYVIIIDNFKHFSGLVKNMIKSDTWNPEAKFVIFLINFKQKTYEECITKILDCLYKYNVINVIVAVPQVKNIRNAIICSWKPYDPPKYCGYFHESAKDRFVIENVCERGVVKYDKNLFYNKFPLNMQQCQLTILALEKNPFISSNRYDPNIEKFVIETLFKQFNLTSRYIYSNEFRGERNTAGKWDGGLKHIVAQKAHILMGAIFPDFDVHEDFECSLPYLADSYTWVVPRAYSSPPWVALGIIFQHQVWYSVIIGYIACTITWKILGYLSDDSTYNKAIGHCFLSTWLLTLGFCAYVRPTKQSLRIFYVFFNLYCIVFITAYQTKLIDVLQNPTSEQQIDTIEELISSGLKFGGVEQLHDLFINSSDPFDNFIGREWVDVDNMTKAMLDVVIHRNFSVLCSRLELAHITANTIELNDAFGGYTYFAFEKDVFNVPLEMIALRGFPFMKYLSKTLGLHKQLGINDGVRRQFAAANMRKRARLINNINKGAKFKPLSISHLQGGFLALAIGAISGMLVLIAEIVVNTQCLKM